MADKITKDMAFGDILEKYPETAKVLLANGMHCVGCMAAHFETIEQGANAHDIDVDELVKEMNEAIKEKDEE